MQGRDEPGDYERERLLYLERAKQANEERLSEMRVRRERARRERRYNELQAERTSAPYRHFLKEWRLEKGFSLQDLSIASGVSKEMISRYESNKRGLSIDVQCRLIAALGIRPSQFWHSPKSDIALLIEAAETSTPEMRERMLAAIRELQGKL